MKNIRLLVIVLASFTLCHSVSAQYDLSKFRLVYNGKEIKLSDITNPKKDTSAKKPEQEKHDGKIMFKPDYSTDPPTLYITEVANGGKSDEERADSLSAAWVGKKAPVVSIKDINGKNIKLDKLKGKVLVLNFYFTSCMPCLREMPELNKLVDTYKNNKDVVFIAFAMDDKAAVTSFLQKHPFTYQQVPQAGKITNDSFLVTTWPTHIIIDKNGTVQYFAQGYFEHSITDLKQKISTLTN